MMPTFELLHVRSDHQGVARRSSTCPQHRGIVRHPGQKLRHHRATQVRNAPDRLRTDTDCRRTWTDIFAARRRCSGEWGEWHHNRSSNGINKLSMSGERGTRSGTESGSKTLDHDDGADVGDAGRSSSAPQRRGADTPLTPRPGNRASALGLDRLPGDLLSPNPRHGVPASFCSRAEERRDGDAPIDRRRFCPGGHESAVPVSVGAPQAPPAATRLRLTGGGSVASVPDWCCRGTHKTAGRRHCRAKSASTRAVADAVFAAVFVVASAVAVWPARCTVAVKRSACAGPSVRNSHSGGA